MRKTSLKLVAATGKRCLWIKPTAVGEKEREKESVTLFEPWIQPCLNTTLKFQLFECTPLPLLSHSECGFLPLAYQGNVINTISPRTHNSGSLPGWFLRGNFLPGNSESATYIILFADCYKGNQRWGKGIGSRQMFWAQQSLSEVWWFLPTIHQIKTMGPGWHYSGHMRGAY